MRDPLLERELAGLIGVSTRRFPSTTAIAGAIAVVLVLAACGGSDSSSSASPRCSKPPAGIGPDATATLQDQNAGGTYCLARGDVLTVFLHAPVDQDRWGAISATPTSVLRARSTGVMTLPIGVTAGDFVASRTGTVALRSSRPPCHPPATVGCDATHQWSARLVVR